MGHHFQLFIWNINNLFYFRSFLFTLPSDHWLGADTGGYQPTVRDPAGGPGGARGLDGVQVRDG